MERIVEIGGGNGNLLALLHKKLPNTCIVDVDLPETLVVAIVFLADMFPDASMLLPNEVGTADLSEFDFVFLTPDQIEKLKDNSTDLFINTDSFQEMTHGQISQYFNLIQRAGRDGSHFFTRNRVEKIPWSASSFAGKNVTGPPPNRFCEYPWAPDNKILVYESCKLRQLVGTTNMMVRLEQISKPQK